MSDSNGKFVTNSIAYTAYCVMNGLHLQTAKKLNRRFHFEFKEIVEEGEALRPAWVSSESKKYDDAMRGIKSLLYPHSNDGDGGN